MAVSAGVLSLVHIVGRSLSERSPEALSIQALSFQPVSVAGGIKLMARSVSAVIVRLGLTPRLADTTDPSQIYIFL